MILVCRQHNNKAWFLPRPSYFPVCPLNGLISTCGMSEVLGKPNKGASLELYTIVNSCSVFDFPPGIFVSHDSNTAVHSPYNDAIVMREKYQPA